MKLNYWHCLVPFMIGACVGLYVGMVITEGFLTEEMQHAYGRSLPTHGTYVRGQHR